MTGLEIKEKLKRCGFTQSEIAVKLGVSPQTFNAYLKVDDIKTGLLENIATAIGKDISFFYHNICNKNNSASVNGNGNSVVSGEHNKLEVSKCQDELEAAMREIQYLKNIINEKDKRLEGKDKLLEEKERLINVLMNK